MRKCSVANPSHGSQQGRPNGFNLCSTDAVLNAARSSAFRSAHVVPFDGGWLCGWVIVAPRRWLDPVG